MTKLTIRDIQERASDLLEEHAADLVLGLLADLCTVLIEREDPPLTTSPEDQTGERITTCYCGEERDEPHTWAECAEELRRQVMHLTGALVETDLDLSEMTGWARLAMTAGLAECERLRLEMGRLERDYERKYERVEDLEDRLASLAAQVGCDREYSNAHDHRSCIDDGICRLTRERDEARANVRRLTDERDAALEWRARYAPAVRCSACGHDRNVQDGRLSVCPSLECEAPLIDCAAPAEMPADIVMATPYSEDHGSHLIVAGVDLGWQGHRANELRAALAKRWPKGGVVIGPPLQFTGRIADDDSPPFRPAALDELEARGFERVNRHAPQQAAPTPLTREEAERMAEQWVYLAASPNHDDGEDDVASLTDLLLSVAGRGVEAPATELRADVERLTRERDCATMALADIASENERVQCLVARPGERTYECDTDSPCEACAARLAVGRIVREVDELEEERRRLRLALARGRTVDVEAREVTAGSHEALWVDIERQCGHVSPDSRHHCTITAGHVGAHVASDPVFGNVLDAWPSIVRPPPSPAAAAKQTARLTTHGVRMEIGESGGYDVSIGDAVIATGRDMALAERIVDAVHEAIAARVREAVEAEREACLGAIEACRLSSNDFGGGFANGALDRAKKRIRARAEGGDHGS